ncbi:DUF4272 domain-containing protein [Entomomonas asaccharolytica]|uniref:DUF4272 domain-containing protein n=1 Tax=Entomomonas asaccharolytica TaxID=2785331 RepID=A0A974NDE7_9GAMM|nr:DUF4272 domain-containing protein [Entomomonas asaccharolytica]QQP84746.1 DUF4272 domain-containing protein [Entomomonas asaccharolytica]
MSILVNAYSTVTNPPAIHFPCERLHQRGLDDAELLEHLNGFVGYVMNAGDGQMNARRYALYRHIQRVKHQFSFEIEKDKLNEFAAWGWQANVIVFMADGTLRNPNGAVLQYADGNIDLDADVPYPAEALQRKARSEQYLQTLGLSTPISLPPVVAESEVVLRAPDEVAKRALAVMLTSIQAESFRDDEAIDPAEFTERCPLGVAALSANERDFIESKQPTEQDIVNMSWRYEALLPLQWAINWQAELPFADTICDVSSLVEKGMQYSEQGITTVTLRSTSELLDALDLHYRLHWIARNFRIKEKQPPASILEGVIQERHHTLNWLTCFENADWDDVDTPT